ncbi:uncharacterized protein LOC133173486 [Saccostrea echinata]|uniref:uncharacterized protein LOC133173486 n=1 Tax=Saccostrea echinata TaxID=191078 RepID=UPI002A81B1DA|nr:uncharacterized protein LOC133173486 [Saccostrea echinata]
MSHNSKRSPITQRSRNSVMVGGSIVLAVLVIVTTQQTPGPRPSGSCTNTTGLPCPHVCPCYQKKAPEDCFSFDEFGNPLPCPMIDVNVTLARARNETSEAGVFMTSSIMGTCSRYAKYLDTWAALTDATKQKIKTFLSNPTDPSITYQDVEKMPIEAFAAANKTLWQGVMFQASDRQKLAIQMKVLMSKDCEVQSILKGLNFTKLYLASVSKSEVNSSIFKEDLCRALLRNCSFLPTDFSRFINTTAPNCYSHVSEDCSGSKDGMKSGFFGNFTGLPCPMECPCYQNKGTGDSFSFDKMGNPQPCPNIDMNVTLSRARNETSEAGVFMASSIMGTCSRYAKYLDTWAGLTDATKQNIKAFLSNPADPSITYQDVEKMPIEAFAAANKTLWQGVMFQASDRQKLAIQMKVLMSKDCEVQSILKGLNFTKLYLASVSKSEVNSSIFKEDLCRALLRNCSFLPTDFSRFINTTAPNCYSHVSEDCSGSKDGMKSGFFGNFTGLPCPMECPCYQNKGTGDSFSFDKMGNPQPCPNIDMNVTLSRARNETSEAGVFMASSIMGTCSRYAKYLDTWAGLTDATKQNIKAFLSNPADPSITYQDVEKMPIEAFAAANKTLWQGVMFQASDRQKLAIQMKVLMSKDCEVQSILKGLNFTKLYLASVSKSEVNSSIFKEDLCRALLRNCSFLPTDFSRFINTTAPNCYSHVSEDCSGSKDGMKSGFFGNFTGLPCPMECPCYQNKGTGDSFSFDKMGNPQPCPNIDMNVTLSRARNETSEAGVFTASSIMGTCSRYAKYLDTWAGLTDATKQKIKTFLSNPADPSITYQDVEKMPIQAFAAANKTLWREVMSKATDRKKLAIQIKILMSNDCEVESMLRGLNFTQLYLNSEAKSEVNSSIFDEKLCRAVLRNCSFLSPSMWRFINTTASNCLPYVSHNCTQIRGAFMPMGNMTKDPFMSMPTKDPFMSMPTKDPSMSMPTKDPSMTMPTKDPSMSMPTKDQFISMSTRVSSMSMPTKSPFVSMPTSMPTRSPSSVTTQSPVVTPKQFSGCDPGAEGLQCPRNCPQCYSDKTSTDCYSYDKYGNFLGCQSFAKNTTMMRALNDTSAAMVFTATAEIGTCSRLAKYLRKWISLADSTKEKALQYLRDPKSVTDDDVKRIPIEVFAIANKTLLDNVTRQASTDQKLYLATSASLTRSCQVQDHLSSFNLEQTFKDAKQAGTVDSTYFNASLCKAFMDGQCDMPISKWQFAVDHAQECLLDKAVCLKDVNDETLGNLLSVDSMKNLCNKTNIDDRSKSLFQSRLNSYLGNKTTFPCDQDFLLLMNLCNLKPKYVTKFCNNAKVAEYTPSREQSREWEIIKTEFLSTKVDFSTMDKTTLSSYLPISKSTMKSLDAAVLTKVKEAVCTDNVLDDAKFTDDQKREVMDVLRSKGKLNKTADKDCLLKYAPAEIVDSLSDSELTTAYNQNKINVTKLTPPQAKRLLVQISGSLTSETQIKDNADLLVRGGSNSLPSLKGKSAETKKAYIKSIKNQQQENKVNPSVVTAVVEASLDTSDREGSFKTLASESSEDMMSYVPQDFITDMSPADVQSLASWPDMKSVKLPKNLEKALMKKVQDTGIALNDPDVVSNLVAVVGSAPKSLFNTIDTNNANCPTILSSVTESEAISAEKYEHVCKKLETCLTSTNVDLSDASTLSGNALACFNKTALKAVSGSCSDITTKVCTADFSLLDGKQRKSDIKEYVFECLGISNTITGSHINSMGSCAELLSDSDIPKMDLTAMEAVFNILSSKFTCLSKIGAYVEKYVTLKGSSSITTTDIVHLGDWAIHLQSNIFSGVTGICDTVSTIGKALKTRDAIKQELVEEGLFTECKEEIDDIKKEIGEYIIAAIEDCTSARRRKRNTATITCSQLNDMGSSMLSSLTTSQLSGIQDADFIQCVSLLGTPTDYSAEQKQALASIAKRGTVYGSPSTWSSSTIQSLGSIVQGLTSEELDTMTFIYDDIAQLGAYSGWQDSQKTTIFGNWSKSSAIPTITSSELRSLGHMICAMSTSQIQQITRAVYEASADKVGEVTSCSDTQMVEFANHAKTAFGSVYNWTSVQITNVGAHIGGLSKTEIATLTEAQIDEILASHVTLIPSTVFSGFTSTQLRNFSPAQAQATTTTQRSTLDSSQMSALESAAGTTFSSSSGVDRAVQMSWMVISLSVLLALFF